MTNLEQPSISKDQTQSPKVPAFLEGNPDGIAAYLRGLAKADQYLRKPGSQVLPVQAGDLGNDGIYSVDAGPEADQAEGVEVRRRAVLGSRAVDGKLNHQPGQVTEILIPRPANPNGRSPGGLKAEIGLLQTPRV